MNLKCSSCGGEMVSIGEVELVRQSGTLPAFLFMPTGGSFCQPECGCVAIVFSSVCLRPKSPRAEVIGC